MKKETLVSIAERSGCSISTVSRVLSGNAAKYRISQRTVARVTEEVKRCNYTPSLLAKGLRTNRTDTIGLLIPNIENSFFAGVAGVVLRESRNYNYKVVVVDTQEDERNEQDGLSALLARRVDGIVAAPCGSNSELFASVQEGGMPLVLIDRYLPDAGMLSYVTTDNYRGAVMATEYLLENGHRRIACIQGTPHSMPVRDRVRGFGDTLRAHGLGDRIVVTGEDFSVQNGYLETKLALAREELFFDQSMARFLQITDHTGSMQTACRQMHMSYTKGWKMLKAAEKQLGHPLLITQSGGAEGGSSRLSPQARELLDRYFQMEKELNETAKRLFETCFLQGNEELR